MTRCFTAKPTCECDASTFQVLPAARARVGARERRTASFFMAVFPFLWGGLGEGGFALRGDGGDLLHGLELDRDLDLLADEHAARLERGVPDEAELAAVEGRLGGEARALVAPGILARAGKLGVEDDLLLHAVELKVARH